MINEMFYNYYRAPSGYGYNSCHEDTCQRAGDHVNGLWSGTTLVTPCYFISSGRCNAQNKITLKLTQQNNRIVGNHTCAYGTMICRHGGADNTGKVISGRISGNQIRLSLMIPSDGSNCYYNGMLRSPTTMHGAYMCYNGADLVKEGIWDVKLG
jgi:hypothetical protein